MQTSDRGRAALELEEGVVLRAYRDVAGIWTIGAGLTAASGVVKPVAGMVITREQADEMLAEALKRYERDVEIAMTTTGPAIVRPSQQAFDAGVSFHFNTGAISRASWVAQWKAKAPRALIVSAICLWSKAGGKVLPALRDRREREAAMLLDGQYRSAPGIDEPHPVYARWALRLSDEEVRAVFDGLRKLGYDPGAGAQKITRTAVERFQADHGLTVDAIIGRATLTTLQRRLDQQSKVMVPTVALAATLVGGATGVVDVVTGLAQADIGAAVAAGAWLVGHLWTYRDAIAANLSPLLPGLASYLRSR